MLTSLKIEKFGLFDRIEIEFERGFTAITGESGSGKSLILKALGQALGDSPLADLVQGDSGYVEAVFDGETPDALKDVSDGDLVLARKIGSPSRSLVGGRTVSNGLLKEGGAELVSLIGQHSARKLVAREGQKELIDTQHDHPGVAALWRNVKEAEKTEAEIRARVAASDREVEVMRGDVESWDEINPEPGEQEALETEIQRLGSVDEVAEALTGITTKINGDGGALDLLGCPPLIQRLYPDLFGVAEQAADQVRALARETEHAFNQLDRDPYRLDAATSRVAEILALKRRFRNMDMDQIHNHIETARARLSDIGAGEVMIREAERKTACERELFQGEAEKLTVAREKAAKNLMKQVNGHLRSMDMGQISVKVKETVPGSSGKDQIIFTYDGGLGPREISKGASGGELSRINLAVLLATKAEGVFVFDEIDTGISGEAAHRVGEQLVDLAKTSQVIAVTHLAPVAARAGRNLLVRRGENPGFVSGEDRDKEIARLAGAKDESAGEIAKIIDQGI